MWVAARFYRLLGTPMSIRFSDAEPVLGMDRLLEPFRLREAVPVRARNQFALVDGQHRNHDLAGKRLAYRDCARLATAETWGAVVGTLMAEMNRRTIDECPWFAVHSGVVSRDGMAIALPGVSGGGKSTLTGALVRQGFAYVSDEALCIDPETGEVVPYPKPLGLSRWSLGILGAPMGGMPFPGGGGETLVPGEELGMVVGDVRLALRHIVLAEHGHDATTLEPVAASQAMTALLQLSFNHYRFGETAFRLAARIANQVDVWALRYADPTDAAALIASRMG